MNMFLRKSDLLSFVLSPLLVFLGAFPYPAFAGQESTFNDHLKWSKSVTQQTQSRHGYALNPDDYCKDASCRAEIDNPVQSQLTNAELESKAQAAYITNPLSQAINAGLTNQRPDIENDGAYQFALIAQDNAYEISHGLSNQFVDCEARTLCRIDQVERTCKSPTNNPVTCTRTPTFSDLSLNRGNSTAVSVYVRRSFYYYPQRINTPAKARFINAITLPKIMVYDFPGFIHIFSVNGVVVFEYRGTNRDCGSNWLCRVNKNFGTLTLSRPIAITNHRISLSLQVTHSNGSVSSPPWASYDGPGTIVFHWNAPSYKVEWTASCGTLIPECVPQPERCVEAGGTRDIDGIKVTLPCWRYETVYRCNTEDTCTALSHCTANSRACNLMQNGVCVEETHTKSCEERSCQTNTLTCGETSFCLDGDCYEGTPTQSTEFQESVAALAAISAAAEDLGEPPTMFTGRPMKCTKSAAGFKDCCKDSGWGKGVGASCDAEDKALSLAKKAKLTLYVGQYCAKKIVGFCTRKKRTYCTYDSKLARIIQEQGGKHQLGLSNGTPKDPLCNPLTPEQLQQIDFERLDFSDFYGDMMGNIALPNEGEIKDRVQNGLGRTP